MPFRSISRKNCAAIALTALLGLSVHQATLAADYHDYVPLSDSATDIRGSAVIMDGSRIVASQSFAQTAGQSLPYDTSIDLFYRVPAAPGAAPGFAQASVGLQGGSGTGVYLGDQAATFANVTAQTTWSGHIDNLSSTAQQYFFRVNVASIDSGTLQLTAGGVTTTALQVPDGINTSIVLAPGQGTNVELISRSTPCAFCNFVSTDNVFYASSPVAAVPEPSTWATLSMGLVLVAFIGRRRAKGKASMS